MVLSEFIDWINVRPCMYGLPSVSAATLTLVLGVLVPPLSDLCMYGDRSTPSASLLVVEQARTIDVCTSVAECSVRSTLSC